ncbi:YidH family protein [Vreelandella massiliensis]|uniref:YidH family protein n=1 Tax=Vreelandella massiliensis TaxID=1816686 RepID=UPI00096A75C0|nr:DUF202 domain-containing protein [Halomonas massiliensis]MYL23115.1 DUF202 domain-containing protein [Halomonas alkaliantarctica]
MGNNDDNGDKHIGDKGSKTELAENRTEFAEDRTVLANERTLAGWFRTGLTAVGVALGFHALFGTVSPRWGVKLIATAFLLVAVVIFVAATWHAVAVMGRLNTHVLRSQRQSRPLVIGATLATATLALTLVLWILD